VQVVDKQEHEELHVAYNVAFDDTALTEGDIVVSDAKTHQFFAFRGALLPYDFNYELFSFTRLAPPVLLPEWITAADVKRAAQATNTLDGTAFSEQDIPEGAVLDANLQLTGAYLRVTADDARVPITFAQALKGVDWPLADVEPGLYTFAGYVFSPPYNAWSPRARLIEVVDGSPPGPAAQLARIEGGLFPYQGRIVRGCIAAPEGSTVSGSFTVLDRPEHGWIEWLASTPVASSALELCFQNPRPELTGSARLRLDVTTVEGETRSFYSIDTVTVLPGNGRCTPSATVCCPAGSEPAPCAQDSAGCAASDAGREAAGEAGGARDASAPIANADSGASGEPRAAHDSGDELAGDRRESGCAVGAPSGLHGGAKFSALVLWLAFAFARLTRRRAHRTTASVV
jgi:hypothetical protein